MIEQLVQLANPPKPEDADANLSAEQMQEKTAARNNVKQWVAKIKAAKRHFEPQFKRMQEDMDFVTGLQWDGQTEIHDKRYVCNITLQNVNQKVATLYARNPEAIAQRRRRLDFRIWDEKPETIMEAMQRLQMSGGMDVEAALILMDYQAGRKKQEIVRRVCQTLETVYQYETDTQDPEFKEQMKQLVRTVVVCGVGFVRINFARSAGESLRAVMPPASLEDKVKRARVLLDEIGQNKVERDDAKVEQLKLLLGSFGVMPPGPDSDVEERLIFDFVPTTSVIVDRNCRSLKTFAGAHWIAIEYILPVETINTFFDIDIKTDAATKYYTVDGEEAATDVMQPNEEQPNRKQACLWEVLNKDDGSRFYIVDGYRDYAQEPRIMTPTVHGFWPLFGLTFNDVVTERGSKASIYPPSDVDLMRSAQKEWNRTREALRGQRRANAPKYPIRAGLLTEQDKDRLESAEPNQVIELQGIPNDMPVQQFIVPLQHAAIDPMAYDTRPLVEDMMFAARAQEANMGPASKNVTATVGTIAEQSRMTVASSNVDDLDGLLTRLAQAGGEILLREMSQATVMRIAGEGAAWPVMNREDFLNEIQLEIVASSSGRPNKAMEIANAERLGPLLLQAGANPQFLVRELVKRLDDRLDVNEAFPLVPPTPTPLPQGPEQPLPQLASGAAMPLAGA